MTATDGPGPADRLDLRGVKCPGNAARALVRLESMDAGEDLELWLDDGEPIRSVPDSLAFEGHEILRTERRETFWCLVVRARG